MDKYPHGYHSALSALAAGIAPPASNVNSLASALGVVRNPIAVENALARAGIDPQFLAEWRHVIPRFDGFLRNISLTQNQIDDARKKLRGVISCLNLAYYGHGSETDNAFLIGSWGKQTQVRPPRDVDLYFLLPPAIYHRFQGCQHNKQSALLQEIKDKLFASYPRSDIKGDGPVVLANFVGTFNVEIVPAFILEERGAYWVCDTKNGGSYQRTRPWDELVAIDGADQLHANNARPLIKMLKVWQAQCNVPIKSFYLELLAIQFLDQSQWRQEGLFYYDWICRDFFSWLCNKVNTWLVAPGTNEFLWLGDRWRTMAETAARRANLACDYERASSMVEAGDMWQMIFGDDMPRVV